MKEDGVLLFCVAHQPKVVSDKLEVLIRWKAAWLTKPHMLMKPGFHTERGGGAGIPSQPQFSLPRNLEIEYGYYLHVTERMCHQNVRKFCPRWGQKQSERYINSRFSWGGEGRGGSGGHAPQTPMHGFHTLLSSCYHPVPPLPTQNPV